MTATTAYKSILTSWDSDPTSAARAQAAIDLARALDAHLTIVALGYGLDVPPYAMGDVYSPALADLDQQAIKEAGKHAEQARALIEREGVAGEAVELVSTSAGLVEAFGRHAQFADLVVLGQPYGTENEAAAVRLLEGTLFEGDAAVLLLPEGGQPIGGGAVIAWNNSREALRAVRKAMPLLALAERVEVAMIDPAGGTGNPGDDLALMLARHGLSVEVTTLASAGRGASQALRQHLQDKDANLVVMGAYGHSRLREYVFGGVTQDFLRSLPAPILMAH